MLEQKHEEVNEEKGYKIQAYLPYTSYPILNREIVTFIESRIDEFKKEMDDFGPLTNQVYTMLIHYDTYAYKNYVTYVFTIFLDTAGAHPNTYIKSITFDKEKQQIVTIDSLVRQYPNLLKQLSTLSLEELKHSEKFKEQGYQDIIGMLEDGTKPIAKNFRNFAFTEKGLLLFFENYQVAPYFYGSFQVNIPYSSLFS